MSHIHPSSVCRVTLRLFCACCALALLSTLQSSSVTAAEHPHAKLPSADVQGEYVGNIVHESGMATHGVQVIARGDGKYEAVSYEGGLPGDGATEEAPRKYQGAKNDQHAAFFKTDKFSASIDDGVLTVLDAEGNEAGVLRRVERKSPTLGSKPPKGATVLFQLDGENDFPKSRIEPGLGMREGVTSSTKMADGTLHVEFMLPLQPKKMGQQRGNSGVYLQSRYEVQVLDSFGLEGKNNECGGIYGIKAPSVNMCLPPLQWQTYDIDFTAAKYADGKQTAAPRVTVRHNGVVIHDDVELPRTTTASPVKAGSQPGPLYLQNHGNTMIFRNVWFQPRQAKP